MNPKVLVADDDASVQRVVQRALSTSPSGYDVIGAHDGGKALEMAATHRPDVILLDLEMPVRDGWSVLKELRLAPQTRAMPIILITGHAEVPNRVEGLAQGADDIIAKPFAIEELRARVDRLLRRVRQDLAANPLTLLPGNPAIEEEVTRRLELRLPFAFFHADIDRFKSYNDAYGFARGDEAIRRTAEILQQALDKVEKPFLGHIGGDDFALLTSLSDAAATAQRAARFFDLIVPDLYDTEDFARGCVESRDRRGHLRRFPLIRLSMGIVTTQRRRLGHYGEVVEIAAEMKRYLKGTPDRGLSRFAFDRRGEGE